MAFAPCRREIQILVDGSRMVSFNRANDVVLHMRQSLPAHPNGMRFQAFDD